MRRIAAPLTLVIALVACATPEIHLEPRFDPGGIRTYRLTVDAGTRIDVAGLRSDERTRLVAGVRIEVTAVGTDTATLAVRITPTRFERGGRSVEPPPPQEATVEMALDGTLRSVTSVGGLPAEQANIEELVTLLGTRYPRGRVRLGHRWRTELPEGGGEQRARIAGLRVVGGERTAVVAVATRRAISLERPVAGISLTLAGDEISASEIFFAFDRGFPVRISSEGETHLSVEGGSGRPGSVVIRSASDLVLVGT